MSRRVIVSVVVCAAALLRPLALNALQGTGAPPVRTIKGGVLDQITLYVEKLPASTHVVIRPFSATDADLTEGERKEETRVMQGGGPGMLAEHFVEQLKAEGRFADVAIDSGGELADDTLIVEGRFNELDPGSRAKRYFAGFGAGKSAVGVIGTVTTRDGTVLASFAQRRIGVMGAFGGDSLGKLAADTRDIGEDIARFLSAWAAGRKLK